MYCYSDQVSSTRWTQSSCEEHKHGSDYLYLDEGLPFDTLPKLLRWVQQSGGGVKTLICNNSERNAELAVAALSCAATANLTIAVLSRMTHVSVGMLSVFPQLTRCDLKAWGADGYADLEPLQVLHNLDCLNLGYGTYENVHVLGHLTRLYSKGGTVQIRGECRFAHSLIELHAEDSEIDLYDQGLSVCTALTSLTCHQGNIKSSVSKRPAQKCSRLGYGPVSGLPCDILRLTRLTTLDLDLAPEWSCRWGSSGILQPEEYVNLEWMGALVNLQNFCFKACCEAEVRLGRHWGKLQQLKTLCVQNLPDPGSEEEQQTLMGVLCLSIPWESLQALESVCLGGKALAKFSVQAV